MQRGRILAGFDAHHPRNNPLNIFLMKLSFRSTVLRKASQLMLAVALAFTITPADAQTIAPAFASDYSLISLGAPDGVPAPLGGLTLLAGDANTLLIGGDANRASGAIYSIGVTRDMDGHIDGFTGQATLFATAPFIDGGLAYGPNGILFATTYADNNLLQYKPGSAVPDKVIDLTPLGVSSSTGTVNFVPSFMPGAGEIRILSYSGGGFYSGTLTPDGVGTFDLSDITLEATTGFGPEGLVYVSPGSPVFTGPSALISEFDANRVSTYNLDSNGIPIPATRADFVNDLSGAEGAFVDPLTGDFLFSTFGGGSQVIVVRGFAAVPEPGAFGMLAMGLVALLGSRRRV
jgi:hypothetical protein